MKICIFGAGAIGGYLGAKLAAHGTDVSLVARGAHLDAMRTNGLRLIEETGETNVSVTASSDPQDLGEQDYLLITLKAHSVPPMVEKMAPLIGKHTTILSCVNGVPWWYFYKFGGDLEGTQLESVDPAGAQWNGFGPEKVLGCVVYPAAEVVEPGVIKHIEGNRFSLGEPDGQKSDRIAALAGIFTEAGLKAPVRPRIRDEIWVKYQKYVFKLRDYHMEPQFANVGHRPLLQFFWPIKSAT